LRSNEAGMVFDAEERQLLVATAKSDMGVSYVRVPLEPTGVTVRSHSHSSLPSPFAPHLVLPLV
jgi:hypothetical protein